MNYELDNFEHDTEFLAQKETPEKQPVDAPIIDNLFENVAPDFEDDTPDAPAHTGHQTESKIDLMAEKSAELYVNAFDALLRRLAALIAGTEPKDFALSREEKAEYKEITESYFEATGKTFSPALLFPITTLTISAGTLWNANKVRLLLKKERAKTAQSEREKREVEKENELLRKLLHDKKTIPTPPTEKILFNTPLPQVPKIQTPEKEPINIENLAEQVGAKNSTLLQDETSSIEPVAQIVKPAVWGNDPNTPVSKKIDNGIDAPFESELTRQKFYTDGDGFYTTDWIGNKLAKKDRTEKISEFITKMPREKGVGVRVLVNRYLTAKEKWLK